MLFRSFAQAAAQWGSELFRPEAKAQRLLTEALGPNASKIADALKNYQLPRGLANVPTTAAQASGDLNLGALELASRTGAAPQWGQFEQARNRALYQALEQSTPRADWLEGLMQARESATGPSRETALAAAQSAGGQAQNVRIVAGPRGSMAVPGYAAPVLDTLANIRNGATGKNPEVQTMLNYVYNQITDPDVPITAEQLYEIRKLIADKIGGKVNPTDTPLGADVKAQSGSARTLVQGIDDFYHMPCIGLEIFQY